MTRISPATTLIPPRFGATQSKGPNATDKTQQAGKVDASTQPEKPAKKRPNIVFRLLGAVIKAPLKLVSSMLLGVGAIILAITGVGLPIAAGVAVASFLVARSAFKNIKNIV